MNALRALLATRRARFGVALATLLSLGLWSNTVTDHIGYPSALIAALLARGTPLREAVSRAHSIVHHALERPRTIGEGLALPGWLREAVIATEPEATVSAS